MHTEETRNENKGVRLLTVRKLCAERDLKPSLIYWWIRNRDIDFIKVGKKVLIPEKPFNEFLERNYNQGQV